MTAPWDAVSLSAAGDDAHKHLQELGSQIGQLSAAALQVVRAGNAAQVVEAARILSEARRGLYRILAGIEARQD